VRNVSSNLVDRLSHRIYGPFRLTLALLGWKVNDILEDTDCEEELKQSGKVGEERTKACHCQPIYVLQSTVDSVG